MTQIATGHVLRAVPRLGDSWAAVEHDVSAPLLRLTVDPACAQQPEVRDVLPAWWRVSAAVRIEQVRPSSPEGPCPDVCLVTVRPSDVDAIGACARALGRALLPGADLDLNGALRRAVAPFARAPRRLVMDMARLHGVLDLDPGQAGELLHVLAGLRTSPPAVRAAHRHVADRVTRMWTAGAECPPAAV